MATLPGAWRHRVSAGTDFGSLCKECVGGCVRAERVRINLLSVNKVSARGHEKRQRVKDCWPTRGKETACALCAVKRLRVLSVL